MKSSKALVGILFVWMIVLSGALPAWPQEIGKATINFIEAQPAQDRPAIGVSAYVTVTSGKDLPIGGLTADAFEVMEDGRPAKVASVERADDPMAVVLAIDTSGSMLARDASGQTSMAAAKAAAAEFVKNLASADRVAIYTFNNSPRLALDFTDDPSRVRTTIDAIQAKVKAGTCLYGTTYAAVKKSAEIPQGRRAIILLTDGRDEKGDPECKRYSANDVIDAATTRAIRVPIYTIGAGPRVDGEELGRIAAFTGGRHLEADSMARVADLYRVVAAQLKQQYRIRYETRTASGEHSLVVKVSENGKTVQDEKRFWSPPLPVFAPPAVAFAQPASGTVIDPGPVEIRLRVTPPEAAAKVRYYVDGALTAQKTGGDLTAFRWDATEAAGGLHVIRAEVIDSFRQAAHSELTLQLERPAVAAPAPAAPPQAPARAMWPFFLIGGAVLLALVGLGVLLRRRRENVCGPPAAASGPPPVEVEDETVFMPEEEEGTPVPMARLTIVKSACLEKGTAFSFKGTARVGRTERNDVNIPDKPVSRRHAEIFYEEGRYRIRDLGSRNGVKIGGHRVAADGVVLDHEALIELGPKTVLQFHCPEAAPDEPDDVTRRYGE